MISRITSNMGMASTNATANISPIRVPKQNPTFTGLSSEATKTAHDIASKISNFLIDTIKKGDEFVNKKVIPYVSENFGKFGEYVSKKIEELKKIISEALDFISAKIKPKKAEPAPIAEAVEKVVSETV